ncbi:ADP-ribosylglycohydrolase family protein [Pelomyxa schiedti]|nr:ADP-ribosylglycohydrolase family protein [Pelomyxa schiedti]
MSGPSRGISCFSFVSGLGVGAAAVAVGCWLYRRRKTDNAATPLGDISSSSRLSREDLPPEMTPLSHSVGFVKEISGSDGAVALSLRDRVEGMFLTMAVGDALGIPFETMTQEQVARILGDSNYPAYFPPSLNKLVPPDHPKGCWTDDTQLSMAMGRGIIHSVRNLGQIRVVMHSIVNEHVTEWFKSTAGWGGTKDSVQAIAEGNVTWKQSGRPSAVGNGILMKLAPLALYYHFVPDATLSRQHKIEDVMTLSRVTHPGPVPLYTACFHYVFLDDIFSQSPASLLKQQKRAELLRGLIPEAEYFEREMLPPNVLERNLSSRIKALLQCESSYHPWPTTEEILSISGGATFQAIDSLTAVCGLFLQEPFGFDTVVRATKMGGDTDSNAAIIGTIVGYILGPQCIPRHLLDGLASHSIVAQHATDFANLLSGML